MKIKYYYKIILLLISIATFYGCAKLDKDYPARDYYTLSVQRPGLIYNPTKLLDFDSLSAF